MNVGVWDIKLLRNIIIVGWIKNIYMLVLVWYKVMKEWSLYII